MKNILSRLTCLLLILLASCTPALTTTPDMTPTINSPTILTAARTPPPTRTVTATFTPTSMATWTPLPTLSVEQALAKIKELLKTNGGCELPCWWGIIPEETSWQSARHFLEPLWIHIEKLRVSNAYLVSFPNPYGPNSKAFPVHIYLDKNNKVESIDIREFKTLSEILTAYGKPDEVWFHSHGIGIISPDFSLVLLYSNRGIMFYFLGIDDKHRANWSTENGISYVQVCQQNFDLVYRSTYLWNPRSIKSFEQLRSYIVMDTEDWQFRPIEKVTNMDIDSFYQVFSVSNSKQCLKSNNELWPNPP